MNFAFLTVIFLYFVPSQPTKFYPTAPFILPYPLLSRRIPSIPETVFFRPCTFAVSFKANR